MTASVTPVCVPEQNVVTASYSSAFWDWRRWEREIDWMALHGVNLQLAFTGAEGRCSHQCYRWPRLFITLSVSAAACFS